MTAAEVEVGRAPMTLDAVLDRLRAIGAAPYRSGAGWMARCPLHDDDSPSLSLRAGDTSAVVARCFGCGDDGDRAAWFVRLLDRLADPTPLPAASPTSRGGRGGGAGAGRGSRVGHYDYRRADGTVVARHVRYADDDGRKTFTWERPYAGGWAAGFGAGTRVEHLPLYRLPELLAADPTATVYVVEGEKDADNGAAAGMVTTCSGGGADGRLPDDLEALRGRHVVVVADNDAAGARHARAWQARLDDLAASTTVVLPGVDEPKADLSDHLAAGLGVDDLRPVAAPDATPATMTLAEADDVFTRWLGAEYDLTALHVVLATAAVQQLDGDPVWLMVVSGSGNAKTETVAALAGAGAHVTSTITSEGALLSATSRKDVGKDATGGLLRKIGPAGVLVVKDFTSILSMNRDARAAVLAALREVYDGRWERNVGTDGGRSLTWEGRLSFVGATTTAYDAAHAVIASMGDRFAVVRMDSTEHRLVAGRQALHNVGHEVAMRAELAAAAGAVLAGLTPEAATLDDHDVEHLLGVADLVTLARTAVERDHRGQVVEAHAPEMPTRYAKMLGQLVRGCLALGTGRDEARAVALRVARDSVPPLRWRVLVEVDRAPGSTCSEVTKALQVPRSTVDRVLQELHLLGLLHVEDGEAGSGWRYRLSDDRADRDVIAAMSTAPAEADTARRDRTITRNVTTRSVRVNKGENRVTPPTDIPGDAPACPHGRPDGDRPDPFVGGRLSCPECAMEAAS